MGIAASQITNTPSISGNIAISKLPIRTPYVVVGDVVIGIAGLTIDGVVRTVGVMVSGRRTYRLRRRWHHQ